MQGNFGRCDEAAKKGLYYNVNKRKKAGTSRKQGAPGSPTAQAWKDAAKTWGIDEATAKSMTCSVCAAFDVSDKMWDCIASGIEGDVEEVDALASIHKGDIGYCNFLHFKCAGTRSCTAFVSGGPIDNKDRTK